MNIPQITLHGLGETSLLASLLIAVFIPLRPLLRRGIGSQWLCVLWLAVLARLLMPWAVESRWSVFNRWQGRAATAAAVAQEPVKIKVSVMDDNAASKTGAEKPIAAPQKAAASAWRAPAMGDISAIAWLSGFAGGLCVLAWRWSQTRRLGARAQPATDERLLHIFASIPKKWRRNVELRMTDSLQVPTLAGILRPQIWMPREWPGKFDDGELRNVLMHELGHARRGDLIVQWFFAFVQCVHWFNPLVWVAGRAARFDREMACDAWVLARSDADGDGYGAALMKAVELLREPLSAAPAGVAMASGRRSLRARISGIGAFRPLPAWRGVLGIVAMLAALATVTTSCKKAADAPGDSKKTAIESSPQPAEGESRHVAVSAKFVVITGEAWKKLCAENPDFKDFAGKFPGLDEPKKSVEEVANAKDKLQEGGWEATSGMELLKTLPGDAQQRMIASLQGMDGVKFISTPAVSAKPGQRAVIEEIREIRYVTAVKPSTQDPGDVEPSEFATKNAGFTLEEAATIKTDGSIDLQLKVTMAGVLGYLEEKEGAKKLVKQPERGFYTRPLFSTTIATTAVNMAPSQCALLGGVTLDNAATDSGAGNEPISKLTGLDQLAAGESSPETTHHVLLVFVNAEVAAPPPTMATPAPVATAGSQQTVTVESKFVEVDEEAWKKLCDEDPAFKEFKGKFPELEKEKIAYADLKDKLSEGQKNAWEIPEGKFQELSVISKEDFIKIITTLNQTKGASLLSAPSVMTKWGQRAMVEIGSEFPYPTEFEENKNMQTGSSGENEPLIQSPRFTASHFEHRNTGMALEVKVELAKNDIDAALSPSMTSFIGYGTEEGGTKNLTLGLHDAGTTANHAVFGTTKGEVKATLEAGKENTVLLGAVHLKYRENDGSGEHTETARSIILVFATITLNPPLEPTAPVPPGTSVNGYSGPTTLASGTLNLTTPRPSPAPDAGVLPYGVAVPGKEGFVTSPYAPGQGDIDVRGYGSGTEVKDPYSGKVFLVP